MPAEYPKRTQEYDEEEDDEEEESEEEEEDEEEELEEWNELFPPEELDEMEDGPSTHYVGGFSIVKKLSQAVAKAQYMQDRVLVFPGAYTEAATELTPNPDDKFPPGSEKDVIVLDEARLVGLHIEGVPFAITTDPFLKRPLLASSTPAAMKAAALNKAELAERKATRALLLQKDSAVGRRVGPWFTYYHAAANAAAAGNEALALAAALQQSQRQQQQQPNSATGLAAATTTTTMGSSIYGATVTPMETDPERFPVISSRLVIRTSAAGAAAAAAGAAATEEGAAASAEPVPVVPLKVYEQEPDDEDDAEDEEGEEDANNHNDNNRQHDDDLAAGSSEGDGSQRDTKNMPSIHVQGLCFTAGATLEPLTDSLLRHCVLGAPSILSLDAVTKKPVTRPRATLLAMPLSEATVERCIIYGGEKYGLYAYPRCATRVTSCLVDGPSRTASMLQQSTLRRPARHMPSVLALLEAKQRQRAQMERAAAASGSEAAGLGLSLSGAMEDSALAEFAVPAPGHTTCEVAVFCDDADLTLTDCMLSNTKLGLLLHDGCKGTIINACDIRCVEEVGVYCYGLAGSANVLQCAVRACGRECLLVVGPTETQVDEATLQFRTANKIPDTPIGVAADDEDEEEEDEEQAEEPGSKHPVFAQHPKVRQCVLTGGVRLQGQVRDGACTDNLLFAPKNKKADSAVPAAVAAGSGMVAAAALSSSSSSAASEEAELASLIQGPNFGIRKSFPVRGFAVVGREGAPRKVAADSYSEI